MYQQGVFFNGGMNTDDEDRLIPNGDYRYAAYSRNYGVNSPSEGALQSMTGNMLQDNTHLAAGVNIVIGSCEDIENKALILFVFNDLNNHSIWRYTVEDAQYALILQDPLLNFQKANQIYHAAVVNNLLYWTDNYFKSYSNNQFNPPRKINIQKAILYTQSGGSDPEGYSEITFNNLDWIKHPPLFSPIFAYDSDTNETVNNLKNKLFQFRYQYVYDDNEESAWSPISKLVLPNYSEYIAQTVSIDPYLDNTIRINIETGSSIVRLIRLAYRIGNTGEFFLYREYDKIQSGWSDYSTSTVNFKNETSGAAISNSERNYDLIPQIAKTIEYLPSNEFAIGNYIEGYDKQEMPNGSVLFAPQNYPIENTAFTRPLATFYCRQSGLTINNLHISFTSATELSPVKYRYQEGDVVMIQIKKLVYPLANTVPVHDTIYFKVPYIDITVYNTDLLKLEQLCNLLKDQLLVLGIGSTVLTSGSGIPGVSWPVLKITGYTWYNMTAANLYSNVTGGIVVFRENKATRTFKSGAKHEFAFQYYDRANRDGTVITTPVGEVYVPFVTDYTDNVLNGPSQLNRTPYYTNINVLIDADYQPPMWADTYQILYKPSTNISNFQQRSVKQVIYNTDSTITLVLDDFYKEQVLGVSINQTPSKGDFVRFVRGRALFQNDIAPLCTFRANFSTSVPYPSFIAYLNLAPFVVETYDPNNYLVSGTFNAPATASYNFSSSTEIDISFSGTAAMAATVELWIELTPGTDVLLASSTVTNTANSYHFVISDVSNISLTIGTDVTPYISISLAGVSPATINFTASNSSYEISYTTGNYDSFNYYPPYVTQNYNLNQELNVLSYDIAGGPNSEEIIVVNNFDSNLLGEYLVYTGSSTARSIATGGFQIEIYTPKKESENEPWYETGVEFPVLNAHTSTRSHGGDTNQVYGIHDGEVTLNCGDVYIRQRIMATGYDYQGGSANIGDANDTTAAWFCEDPHYSDFYVSNWNNKGRVGLFSPFAKQQHLKASIYHTNALIDNTQINGLSRVEFFNNVALKDEHGSINRLMQIGDTLKAFQDKKITSVYIQKAFGLNGDGTNNVILTDKTFAGVRPHDDDYGCIHPGSVSKVENNVFFYDFYNAAAVQATQGGLINICEGQHKFSVGIRSFTNDIRDYESDNGSYVNITSHINRSNGEYTLFSGSNLDEIPNCVTYTGFTIGPPHQIDISGNQSGFSAGTQFTIINATNPSNDGVYTVGSAVYIVGLNVTRIIVDETLSVLEKPSAGTIVMNNATADISGNNITYSFNRQRWSSYMYQPVLWATQFGNRAYTVGGVVTGNMGKLYEEDKGKNELTFFGDGKIQEIQFLFNSNPTIVKRFLTFMTQSNMPFNVGVTIPETNQYPGGMTSNMLVDNFRNQESYYVSKYFRDSSDPNPFLQSALKRLNGRELRGYVLKHVMTNSNTDNKMILFSTNVNFVPSEPMMQ
jgi:hypothetical protein